MRNRKTNISHQLSLLTFAAKASIIAVVVIGVLILVEWITGIPFLNSIFAPYSPMKLITAILLVLSSLPLWIYLRQSPRRKQVLRISGIIIILVSLLTILTYLWGNVPELQKTFLFNFFMQPDNRMAFVTSLIFLFVGVILILFSNNSRTQDDIAHVLFFPAASLSYISIMSYVLNVSDIFRMEGINIAPLTAFSFFLLCLVILFLRPDTWLMRILSGPGYGSIMARRLLPWLLVLPVVISWVRIKADEHDFFPNEVGAILVGITYTISFLLLVWLSAWSVNRIDETRRKAEEEKKLIEQNYALTLASIGDAVIATDEKDHITLMNKEAERLTGWPLQEAVGQPVNTILKLINNHTHDAVRDMTARVKAERAGVRLTDGSLLLSRDGRKIPIDDSGAPIVTDDGRMLGIVIVFRDVTESEKAQDALRETEARLNALITATSDGVYRMSPDWKQMVSMEGRNFLTSVEKPVDDWLFSFIPRESQPLVLETIHKAITSKSKFELEHNVIRQDGSIGWTLSRAIPIMDKRGEIVEWWGIAHDFTDRRNTEIALQQSEELFSKAFNQIPVPTIITRVSDNIMTNVNSSFLTLFEYSHAEVIGHTTRELHLYADYEHRMKALETMIKEGYIQDHELEMITKTGKKLTLLVSSVFVTIHDQRHVLTTYYDITERKETERKMGQLSAIIQHSDLAIISKDLNGMIQTWNPGAEKVYGYRAEETTGKNISMLIPPGEKSATELINEVLQVEKVENYETKRLRKDGTVIPVIVTLSPIRNAWGDIIAISSISDDISEQKKVEETLRAKERVEYARKGAEKALFKLNEELIRSNKELQQFAYLTSHDLQEPLRIISTFTQFLAQRYKGHFDKEGDQFIQYIVESAQRMKNLINDLLTYSRVGSRISPFTEVDFNQVFKKVVQNLAFIIEKKSAVITHRPLPSVLGDESQLFQLLRNLVDNSLKFCKKTPVIHISAKERPDDYLFSVRDNGIGIDQKYADKIFLIFQRLVAREEYEGTGIGLAVCKRIVERHGGEIWFESKEGEGTTFYFTIAKNHEYQLFNSENQRTLKSSKS